MDDDQKHYPPGAEPEKTAEEAPQPAPEPAEDKAPEPEADKPEEKKPEEQPEPEGDAPAPEPEVKKRSIYDAKQEEKARRKEAEANLATERQAREAAESRAADLQALLDKKDEAKTPQEKSEAKDAIDEWADKQGLDGKAVRELTEIIKGALPKPEGGVLTPEEAAEWRAQNARAKTAAEDQAVLHEAPGVRKQLEEFGTVVHDDAEFQAVMAEVVKLSHTKEFHDKPVDYIVYANRDALKKMISPKKPSFEQGGQAGGSSSEGAEFSGKMTPMQAQDAVHDRGRGSSFDIRRST